MLTPVNLHISNCQYKIKQAGSKCGRYSSGFFLSWTNFTVRNSDIFRKIRLLVSINMGLTFLPVSFFILQPITKTLLSQPV